MSSTSPTQPQNLQAILQATHDPMVRRELARDHLLTFAYIYFSHYFTDAPANFHFTLFDDLTKLGDGTYEAIAFRGSAKSTIATLIYALWSAMTGRKKFIVISSESEKQTRLHVINLVRELEENHLLRADFGYQMPDKRGDTEWQQANIVLRNGCRILGRSTGQKVRGIRHRQSRPDLFIGDDIESKDSVKQREQRDKTEEWLRGEVFPAMQPANATKILVGNLIHMDGVMMRMKKTIEKSSDGIVRMWPLVRPDGTSAWESRYPVSSFDKMKLELGERYWLREMELKIVPDEGQIIHTVQYYDKLPTSLESISLGVDLAISEKQSADRTAINTLAKSMDANFYNINAVAGRWSFDETLKRVNAEYHRCLKTYPNVSVFLGVEDVAYQRAAIQELRRRFNLPVIPIKQTTDKRSRLWELEPYFAAGQVWFRRNDDAEVVSEIIYFGVEEHDDRADAFEISMRQLIETKQGGISFSQ